jgi:hypothetical protein
MTEPTPAQEAATLHRHLCDMLSSCGVRQPIALDLCCGKGGWARGLILEEFCVIGVDIIDQPDYPGHFIQGDVCLLLGGWLRGRVRLIVASPPCEEFSRHDMPWTRKRNPPPPDLSIAESVKRISEASGAPTVVENTRGSKKFLEPLLGPARRCGSFYLYGDVPVLLPKMYPGRSGRGVPDREAARRKHCRYDDGRPLRERRPGEQNSKERREAAGGRAVVPLELARAIGAAYIS